MPQPQCALLTPAEVAALLSSGEVLLGPHLESSGSSNDTDGMQYRRAQHLLDVFCILDINIKVQFGHLSSLKSNMHLMRRCANVIFLQEGGYLLYRPLNIYNTVILRHKDGPSEP